MLLHRVSLALVCDLLQAMLDTKYFFGETRSSPLHLTGESVVKCGCTNATGVVVTVLELAGLVLTHEFVVYSVILKHVLKLHLRNLRYRRKTAVPHSLAHLESRCKFLFCTLICRHGPVNPRNSNSSI